MEWEGRESKGKTKEGEHKGEGGGRKMDSDEKERLRNGNTGNES